MKGAWKYRKHKVVLAILSLLSAPYTFAASSHLVAMTDEELAKTQGQALMSLSYIAPNDLANLERQRSNGDSNIGFYKLGLEADVELNANIKKLQLGCGGVNGAGACDIDIDNLSLSGVSDTNTGRAGSSAKLTNPFIEFAIKNPNSASTREVKGFRLSAEGTEGMLTFGTENSNSPNGINRFSGYMVTQQTGGKVNTAAVNSGLTQAELGKVITGYAEGSTLLLGSFYLPFRSTDYDIKLSSASGNLILPSQEITGKRITTAELTGTAIVSGIQLSGTIEALARAAILDIPISGNLSGTINNLGVNVAVSENLGYFHKVNLNGSPASLALQGQNLLWPGTKSVAETGWWLEFSKPIDIGDVTPSQNVVITQDVVAATLDKVSAYLGQRENAVKCGYVALNCLAGNINVGNVDLTGQYVPMNLSNLVLKNQNFAPNCYGGLRFC